jgi:type II secretory pathway pseudopilin PulG
MKENPSLVIRAAAGSGERGFTLIDLMAVIATVAILAALVLPALARTDDNGARMVCMHNLRQMGMAENMYAGDNRDSLAFPNFDGGAGGSPPGWLYTVTNGVIPNPVDTLPWKTNPISAWRTGTWFQYVQNSKAYLCPVDIESVTYRTPAGIGRSEKLSSYVMDGAVNDFPLNGNYPPPCKITDVWSPACYLLWEPDENIEGAFAYNDGSNTANEGLGRLHSANSGNMLCIGGNVQFVTMQTFQQQTVSPGTGPNGRTLSWWSPLSPSGH